MHLGGLPEAHLRRIEAHPRLIGGDLNITQESDFAKDVSQKYARTHFNEYGGVIEA